MAEMTGKKAQDILDEWLELVQINLRVLRLIASYREDYQVVLLSNASAPFLRRILERGHLEMYFDQIMISSEEKLAKPDVRIYIRMLERTGMQPEQTIMIDDNPNNIEGAKAAGIYGVLFENAQSFEEEFSNILARCFGRSKDQ
ncbi:MAG: hypothetical protein A2Y24_00055 [Clostridiales bacterium GWE2_32_10]|nr:MAG: hypothetical protein A2Y24_00055 [Clostridiales bacterium GWE2_32_10]